MKFFTPAWVIAYDAAAERDWSELERPEWRKPPEDYATHLRELGTHLPDDLRQHARRGGLHDGVVLAICRRDDELRILVAVHRGEDELARPVQDLVELKYTKVHEVLIARVERGDGRDASKSDLPWPQSAALLYDEVDVCTDSPGRFAHRMLLAERGGVGLMWELEVVFEQFAENSASLLVLPTEGQDASSG